MSLETGNIDVPVGEVGGLGDAFYPLFQRVFNEDGDFVDTVEKKLAESRMPDNVEMYLSRALAIGTIAGVSLWLMGTLLGILLVTVVFEGTPSFLGLSMPEFILPIIQVLKPLFIMIFTGVILGSIGFVVGFGSLVAIPYFRSSAREREINMVLSDAISFMYALSVGGLNQLDILRAIGKADDTYGEASKEFQSVILETEYFDTDYRTAIRNQSLHTPSNDLSQFLTDMLSIIDSGGDMTSFLEDQKNKYMRTSKLEKERMLETLELFGEMYMTLSLFPLLLIIILVVMSMMGNASQLLMYITVYGLIPLINVAFLVMVSTVTSEESSDGYLYPQDDESKREQIQAEQSVFSLGLVEQYKGKYSVFERINTREGTHQVLQFIRRPHIFFRENPPYVLAFTVPVTLVSLVISVIIGWAPTSIGGMMANPLPGTFFWVYLPAYINFVPLAFFHEWNVRYRHSITGKLSENLRKLSSANETGMTLLDSLHVVASTSSGRLATEFSVMHRKVQYGTSLKDALREFNNKYHVPRLSRTVKLISEAQEASNQIQDVLSTAAQASENHDDIERDRKSRTRMQVVIIIMTFLTLLGVIAMLKVQFFETMAGLSEQASSGQSAGGQSFGSNMPSSNMLSLLFLHAVTLQAIFSAVIAGYIRNVNLYAGLKYAVALLSVSLFVWILIGG